MQASRYPVLGLHRHYGLRSNFVHKERPKAVRANAGVQYHAVAAHPSRSECGLCVRLCAVAQILSISDGFRSRGSNRSQYIREIINAIVAQER